MKSIKFFLSALMCIVFSNVAFADDKPIPVELLPAQAKIFVQTNFVGKKILYAQKDGNKYECFLDDGTKVEFKKNGTWDKVDCEGMGEVPEAIIPETIKQYVNDSFPGSKITKIDKERHGYDIELGNEIDLKFSHQGELMGMDD